MFGGCCQSQISRLAQSQGGNSRGGRLCPPCGATKKPPHGDVAEACTGNTYSHIFQTNMVCRSWHLVGSGLERHLPQVAEASQGQSLHLSRCAQRVSSCSPRSLTSGRGRCQEKERGAFRRRALFLDHVLPVS